MAAAMLAVGFCETWRVASWNSVSIAEQTMIRAALGKASLAGLIQTYGATMRWAGKSGVPPRSFTTDEQHRLVPHLADAAMSLAAGGLLSLVRSGNRGDEGETVGPDGLRQVLEDPANWIWNPTAAGRYRLHGSPLMRERWSADVYPMVDTTGLPSWEQLSTEQREVLVCAAEASGMLTGAFGIWPDPPAPGSPLEQRESAPTPWSRSGCWNGTATDTATHRWQPHSWLVAPRPICGHS